MRHTILGAGGSIGTALTYELLKSNHKVRLVSRRGTNVEGTESFKADITSYPELLECVKDSDIVHLMVGLPYDIKIWRELWPKIMQNTINACKAVGAKLIFFDNVYMYGKVDGKMTEETPYNPCSKKGEVRVQLARMLENEMKQNDLNVIIARSADFYGPYATQTSIPYVLAIEKLMKGKSAQWMGSVNTVHSYSFTLDCAKGLVLLSEDEKCFNQTWHLPTYNPPITGKEFIEIAAKEIGVAPKYSVAPKFMLKLLGLFNKIVAELNEMLYQSEFDYYFDSTKFNEYFKYQPKSYEEGLHETIVYLKKNS